MNLNKGCIEINMVNGAISIINGMNLNKGCIEMSCPPELQPTFDLDEP